ncbi:MAG TPA: condensation domain-containing protein, partial [Thermoanaerobaculia bacterium]
LPGYMVPSAIVVLDALPLSPAGKLDRRALPAPEYAAGGGRAPATPGEQALCEVFAQVLGLDRVGVEDSFFDLGGHSLLATRVVSQLRGAFQVELGLHELFAEPTVAGLAARVEAAVRAGSGLAAPPIKRRSRDLELPLSFAQQRLWFIDQLEPGSALYNVPIALRASGELSVGVLARTLAEVVRRHEALRTVFSGASGGARQVILPPARLTVPLVDLSGLPPELREPEAVAAVAAAACRPFDLARGPLLRAGVWRLSETEHAVLLAMHHIVSDGWSLGVLVREVAALYPAFSAGLPSLLPELPVQYADFAAWQRSWLSGEVLAVELAYWRERLAGAGPVLALPVDRPRPAVQSFRGSTRGLSLSPPLAADLLGFSRRQGATLFMTLLAAYQALLARVCGESDVAAGTPIAGRNRLETEGLIGFFVNTLVLRTDLANVANVTDLLALVRRETLDAYAHQDLPFEKLVEELAPERSLAHTPLFQAGFALQNAPVGELALPRLRLAPWDIEEKTTKLDLDLTLVEVPQGLAGSLAYATDLFDASTIDRLLGQFRTLLAGAVADPGRSIAELPLLSPAERHQLLAEWSGSSQTPPERLLTELFTAQAERAPEAVAVTSAGAALTYRELDRRSNRLARFLRKLGVGPEVVVGLFVERSPEMLVGLLGVLKAGGAYVPFDPSYPQERLAFLLEDCAPAVMLTQERLAASLPPAASRVVRLDADWKSISRCSADRLERTAEPDDAAYAIYTSGSTGRPKGAVITHRSLVSFALGLIARLGLRADDRVLQFAALSFDVTVEEIFPVLLAGGRVVLRDAAELATAHGLVRAIEEEGVTTMELPTAFWHDWVFELERSGERLPACLRRVLTGTEQVLAERVDAWLALGVPLVHVFGLTEVTVTSMLHVVESGADFASGLLPIGRPFGGTRVYV